jgi:uracil-DNA glycosylase family 4
MIQESRDESRFRSIFRRLHSDHPDCLADEWLGDTCRDASGHAVDRPIVWSRRNGPWRRVDILWVGAAPGNAGGRGSGDLGAHGTRIPFGGDVAGANLDALLGSIGLDRNGTFIVASLNQLPRKGGGEPTPAELRAPVGLYADSIDVLRDTLIAAGPRLVVALGNVAARVLAAAWSRPSGTSLPGQAVLQRAGWNRDDVVLLQSIAPAEAVIEKAWSEAWGEAPMPGALRLSHPSAQNMSPYAGVETGFHRRMVEARDALVRAAADFLGYRVPSRRPDYPESGIYALPEWRERIAPKHRVLDALWREKGI